ncbi:unnamed protein product [Penicillium olsonii]|nr:unnamed protein product [Penicillium olsonii]CAG7929281.1 unnamed protein product [Penicillium olsonii]
MSSSNQRPSGQTNVTQHFEAYPVDDHNSAWSELWDSHNGDLWDKGSPSPALIDALEKEDSLTPIASDGHRKRALVPVRQMFTFPDSMLTEVQGCGKGYDVVMLALHGFDVVGLEISPTGVSVAEEYARHELQDPREYNFGAAWDKRETGTVKFVQGDFFKSDWEDELKYDLIYDYTFLCALHPTMRSRWASRMAHLLSTGGMLVCLEFPLYKDPSLLGPPWGLKGVHWNLLEEGGDGIVGSGKTTGESDGRFRRALYIKPERSYEHGQGTDMLSVHVRK